MPDLDLSLLQFALVFAVGGIASFLNSLAGGGSTLTLPLLIFLGVPPTIANGTNRFAIFCGNVTSLVGLRKGGFFEASVLRLLWWPTALGAIAGSLLGVGVSDRAFTVILAIAMLMVVVVSNFRPGFLGALPAHAPTQLTWLSGISFFLLGLYGGFVQVGIGFLQIFALTRLTGLDLVRVNALKNALALLFIALSSLVFAVGGLVLWPVALVQAAGALLGGWLGGLLQIRKGETLVRRVVAVTSLAMAGKLLYDVFLS